MLTGKSHSVGKITLANSQNHNKLVEEIFQFFWFILYSQKYQTLKKKENQNTTTTKIKPTQKKKPKHKTNTNQNKTIPYHVTDTQEEQDLQEVKKPENFFKGYTP